MIDKYNNQKGALMFLSALLLPLVMAMAGMVIDYGNIYWHKSVLQNSADASALGGAKYGTQTGYFQRKDADKQAEKLLKKNQIYDIESYKFDYLPSKSEPQTKHYYVVTLQEKVPTFFLRYFGFDEMEINATANVPIKSTGVKDPLSCLFCYRDDLYVVNTVESNNPVVTKNFDGDIIYTNDTISLTEYDKPLYPKHLSNGFTNVPTSNVKHFYRTKGWKDVNNVDENDISDPKFTPDIKLHIDSLDAKILEQYKTPHSAKDLPRNITSSDLDNGKYFRCYDSTDLTIDNPIQGDINDPIYIYVQESDVFHLNVNTDSRRPVIICQIQDPGNEWSRKGKIHVTGKNNVTFRGIFYVPDCDELNINEGNMNFRGSIISPSIRTQGEGAYKYERFISSGSGSGSSAVVSNDFSLADDEDIDW